MRDDYANIWTIALEGKGEAKPLTNFKTESIVDFAWSADGKQLALIRGTSAIAGVLISETKMDGEKPFRDCKKSLNLIYDKRRNNLTH